MIQSRRIRNGKIDSAYFETGDGRTPPFLLVHGFTGSKLDFRDQLGWFGGTRRVLAVDQRGHGESSHAQPYSLETLTADLIGFVDALDLPRFHLLGHSMGGMVAMRFAVDHGDRLESLVLMDTTAEPLTIFSPKARKAMNDSVLEKGMTARMEWMKALPANTAAQRGIDYVDGVWGAGEHWRRIEEKLSQMDVRAFVDLGDAIAKAPTFLASLDRIEVPTTILVGEHDTPFIAPSTRMVRQIPNAQLVTIPHAAHSPQYENHDAWRAAIESHLKRSTR